MVLVDEIHNLNHGTPAGEDLSDHQKYFTEHLPATFIYAGIDAERPLLDSVRIDHAAESATRRASSTR